MDLLDACGSWHEGATVQECGGEQPFGFVKYEAFIVVGQVVCVGVGGMLLHK